MSSSQKPALHRARNVDRGCGILDWVLSREQKGMTLPSNQNEARAAATKALLQVFEPLAQFAIHVGLSASELNSMFRFATVNSVATGQRIVGRRVNISGIAALTGIPRSEISRILKTDKQTNTRSTIARRPSIYRILDAWHTEARFTDTDGTPLDLKLYGRGSTFESLVRIYGRGIPARAILDELIRTRTAEIITAQKVRARSASMVNRASNLQLIKALGDRTAELISTMVSNIREPDHARYVATVSGSAPASDGLVLFLKNLANLGSAFLAKMHEELEQDEFRSAQSTGTVGVTVFCHLSNFKKNPKLNAPPKRQNFRRKNYRLQTGLKSSSNGKRTGAARAQQKNSWGGARRAP